MEKYFVLYFSSDSICIVEHNPKPLNGSRPYRPRLDVWEYEGGGENSITCKTMEEAKAALKGKIEGQIALFEEAKAKYKI